MDNDELRDKAFKLGFGYERDFGNCAQCVYKAVSETFGVESDEVFRAAYGLAGGGAGMGTGSCGAYSGGLMAISSRYGRQRFTDGKQSIADDLGQRFYEMFVREYGSCVCRNVQKKIFNRSFDLRDSEDLEEFMDAGAHVDKCTSVVGNAAKWVTEIILEAEEESS